VKVKDAPAGTGVTERVSGRAAIVTHVNEGRDPWIWVSFTDKAQPVQARCKAADLDRRRRP
jgi:hypothetical protein